jgi:beta-fructofuranosidase
MKAAGWSGMMSLPRVLNLDKDGTLRVRVLPQAAALRAGVVQGPATAKTLAAASGEVICSGAKGKSYEFSLSHGDTEILKVSYSGEKHSFMTDGKEIALEPGDAPTLHGYVDGSVVELIAGERIGYTKRFYYPGETAPDVKASADGDAVKLSAWKISPISPNRLTTPAANV